MASKIATHLWQGQIFSVGERRDVNQSARRADELSIASRLKETLREAELSGCAFHKRVRIALVDRNVMDTNSLSVLALHFSNDAGIRMLSALCACLWWLTTFPRLRCRRT